MERAFLEGLQVGEQGLPGEVVDAILEQHRREVDRLRLEGAVDMAVTKAGGRSLKAITALLDMDAIAASENVQDSLQQALSQLKKESGYLFEEPAPPPYARFTGGAQGGTEQAPATLAGALRERMAR